MPFRSRCLSTSCVLLSLLLVGCSSTVRKPQLLHPGPAPYQQDNAVQFDPYPPNDLGPKMVGARPPDFAVPPNEVTRAKQYLDARGGAISAPLPRVGAPAPLY